MGGGALAALTDATHRAQPALRFCSSMPEKKVGRSRHRLRPAWTGQPAPKAAISAAADWREIVAAGATGAS